MIELEVNKKVFATLKAHFPKPENSAERALKKYVDVLTDQLNNAELRGRNGVQVQRNWFHISLYKQRNNSGQIGPNKIRLQNWLEQNNLELFDVIEKGTKFSGKLSLVKLSKLVTIRKSQVISNEHDEVDEINQINALEDTAFMLKLYPNLDQLTEAEVLEQYDVTPIDSKSLQNYLDWLNNKAVLMTTKKKEMSIAQAERILRVAKYSDGVFLQKKKPSTFGRIYYDGVSVQNVSKELRQAMIGHAHEYDIRSAVFTWKMCYAKSAFPALKTDADVRKAFRYTTILLEDKQDFFRAIRRSTFEDLSKGSKDFQLKLIKQAVTAIGFGARLNGAEWKVAGVSQYSSLGEILKNPAERKRFVNCEFVREFVREQSLLDTYIFEAAKKQSATIFGDADVRTNSGRLSKAKVVAFMYQSVETEIMNLVCQMIEKKGKKVIARIHDAVITKQKLSVDDRVDILDCLRRETENPFWQISHKELQAFGGDSQQLPLGEAGKSSVIRDFFGRFLSNK